MDNSLLVSLSHQIAAYRAIDVIANNIANASTPGFKRESAKFEEYVADMNPAEGQTGTQQISFVKDAGIVRDSSQGQLNQTGAPFDLAINGKGYFAVQTPQGLRYTRDGHFSLDAAGQIVNSNGYVLQGDGGAITITPDDGDIRIAPDGTVSGRTGQLAKVRVVDFADDAALTKEGANLYSTDQAPTVPAVLDIRQGALEGSNVQPVLEISHMIEVMRAYEATATLSKNQQDMQTDAVEKLGSMPAA
ncbi:MAG: flagellar basal-body rod protein FlgF [Alphaproteobacteria bacterium]|nr:flagellar basal-body rod protein FlgF [Alphaproteobacteria bacterium]